MAGGSYELCLRMGPVVATRVGASVIEALTMVSVRGSSRGRSGFQLAFRLDRGGELERELLPGGYFDPMVRVIVEVRVGGRSEVIMDGVITQQEVSPASAEQGATLTITGEDLTAMMDLVDLTGVPYPGTPDEGRVLAILARYASFGVRPRIIPPPFFEVPNPLERIPHQQGTDYAYVRGLARAVGYVFYLDPGPEPGMSEAYWGPEVRVPPAQPALAVDMDADTNVESLSFRLDGLARSTMVAFWMERNTKATFPLVLPDISPLRVPLASRPAVPWRVEQFGCGGMSTDPPSLIRRAVGRMLQGADAVTGEGTLDVLRYGRVLQPRRLVGVQGAGPAYDGEYYVSQVTHRIQRGSYKQTFSLAREGTGSLKSEVRV